MIMGLTLLAAVVVVCACVLIYQHQQNKHELFKTSRGHFLDQLEQRIYTLEQTKKAGFDPKAFDELKSKVDAMRFAQGFKG